LSFGLIRGKSPAFVLLAISVLFSGCSWLNELLVFNASGSEVVIRYSQVVNYNMSNVITRPHAYKISAWENGVTQLGDTIKIVSRVENDTMWYVELPANTALALVESMNKDLRTDTACKDMLLQIRYLQVDKPNDAVFICRGSNCFPNLVKISRARAGIRID